MIELQKFQEAFDLVGQYVKPTPLVYSNWLSDELNAEVFLKLECLNPGNSFKIRGATNALLSGSKLPEVVMTASGGNHGLGVAIAAKHLEIPCKVVLPETTSDYRVQLLEKFDAEVELKGQAWDEANRYAMMQAEKNTNALYIHPFADKEVIIGQGTVALEIATQLDLYDLDGFVASVGGGGLLTGNALALEALKIPCEIFAVETKGADSLAVSLEAGKLQELSEITSIAKTLGAKTTTPYIFDNLKRLVNHMLVVSDRDAVGAIFKFLNNEKLLVEPATSCIIAAALQNKSLFENKRMIFVICGSNVSFAEIMDWREEFKISIE